MKSCIYLSSRILHQSCLQNMQKTKTTPYKTPSPSHFPRYFNPRHLSDQPHPPDLFFPIPSSILHSPGSASLLSTAPLKMHQLRPLAFPGALRETHSRTPLVPFPPNLHAHLQHYARQPCAPSPRTQPCIVVPSSRPPVLDAPRRGWYRRARFA